MIELNLKTLQFPLNSLSIPVSKRNVTQGSSLIQVSSLQVMRKQETCDESSQWSCSIKDSCTSVNDNCWSGETSLDSLIESKCYFSSRSDVKSGRQESVDVKTVSDRNPMSVGSISHDDVQDLQTLAWNRSSFLPVVKIDSIEIDLTNELDIYCIDFAFFVKSN